MGKLSNQFHCKADCPGDEMALRVRAIRTQRKRPTARENLSQSRRQKIRQPSRSNRSDLSACTEFDESTV